MALEARATQQRPSAGSAPDDEAAFRRAVPCCGHSFDESLACRCGADWWAHQRHPAQCPVDARGQNRHGAEPDSDEAAPGSD